MILIHRLPPHTRPSRHCNNITKILQLCIATLLYCRDPSVFWPEINVSCFNGESILKWKFTTVLKKWRWWNFLQNVAWIHLSQKVLPSNSSLKLGLGSASQDLQHKSLCRGVCHTLTSYPWTQDSMTPGFPQIFVGVFSPVWLKRGWKILDSSVDSILGPRKWYTEIRTGGRFTRETCLVGGVLFIHTPAASKNLYHLDHPSALPKALMRL